MFAHFPESRGIDIALCLKDAGDREPPQSWRLPFRGCTPSTDRSLLDQVALNRFFPCGRHEQKAGGIFPSWKREFLNLRWHDVVCFLSAAKTDEGSTFSRGLSVSILLQNGCDGPRRVTGQVQKHKLGLQACRNGQRLSLSST